MNRETAVEYLDAPELWCDVMSRLRRCARRLCARGLLDDVVAETLLRTWQTVEADRQRNWNVAALAFRILQHVAADEFRRQRPRYLGPEAMAAFLARSDTDSWRLLAWQQLERWHPELAAVLTPTQLRLVDMLLVTRPSQSSLGRAVGLSCTRIGRELTAIAVKIARLQSGAVGV